MAGTIQTLSILGYLILFISEVGGAELPAENSSATDANQQIRFHNITVQDGLSHYRVRVMTQDKFGFIWMGSGNSLERFDGKNFTTYKNNASDPNSLPYAEVSFLLDDPERDIIWIGTRSGLWYIDIITFRITRVNLGPYNDIRTIAMDQEEGLWIGAQTGLLHFSPLTTDYEVYNTINSNISHNQIRSIYEDHSGNLWVGTLDKLNVMEEGTRTFNAFDLKGDYDLPIQNNLILDITPYSKHSDSLLWIGTETGLCLFNRFTKEYKAYRKGGEKYISNDKVTAIHVADSQKIWVGTDFGLNLFDVQNETSRVFYHIPSRPGSLSNNKIYSIYEDRAGNIWFPTDNGVSLLDRFKKSFIYYPVLSSIDGQSVGIEVNNIIADQSGTFWLGTHQGVIGFSSKNGIIKTIKHQQDDPLSLLADKSLDLYIDEFEKLWIATNKGINVYDPITSSMHSFPADFKPGKGLKSQFTHHLVRAQDGSFWVGAWDAGLHKVTGDLSDCSTVDFKLVTDLDADLFVSSQDTLWITEGSDLYAMDLLTQQIRRVESLNEAVNGKILHSLFYSNKGSIWLGTKNGLIEYSIHTGKAHFYPIQSGRDVNIISILEDARGNIWCCSVLSLFKFDVANHQFDIFPIGKDIPLKGFRPRSCCKTKNGELVFGGQDGFILFDPDAVSLSDYQPEIGISELYVQNQRVIPGMKINGHQILERSIFIEDEITLRYDHRSFRLNFASLQYGDVSGKIFAYKLEGYDTEWKYTCGIGSSAVYSNLPTGRYRFLLLGSNNDGVWANNKSYLQIRIKPPPWASLSFIALYALVTLVLVSLSIHVYRIKARWLKRLEKIRIEKEQNENMALLKQRLFTNISHEFRTPLCLISGPTNEILEKNTIDPENRKLVEIISNNAHRLLRLVNQLIDFRKVEVGNVKLMESNTDIVEFCSKVCYQFSNQAERKKIDYTFSSNIDKLETAIDPGKMETVLFNLLSNAFNYTPKNGKISIAVEKAEGNQSGNGHFFIRVKDSGRGIPLKDQHKIFDRFYQSEDGDNVATGSGIGLTMVKEYVEMHAGNVTVESAPYEGSTFEVMIPIKPVGTSADLKSIVRSEQDQEHEHEPDAVDLLQDEPKFKDKIVYPGNPVILLVEDNHEVIDFIKLGLAEKYNFRLAENGKVALQMVGEEIPDLIISDVMMPEVDGYTLCKTVKESPKTSHIPFILLSALTLTDQQIEGIRCGADAYLTKPFIIKYLDALIENLFHRKELLVEYTRMQSILNPAEINVTSTEEKILKQVITFIESHISDPELSVQSICGATGFSHSYLYRMIKRITGGTLNELIKDIRIKRAAQLLKTRKLTIAEVMVEVGFSSHSYFSKCFRKVFGRSPGNYVENMAH